MYVDICSFRHTTLTNWFYSLMFLGVPIRVQCHSDKKSSDKPLEIYKHLNEIGLVN
jgi:hypothetical protein